MGRNEWGFLVKTTDDISRIVVLVSDHNSLNIDHPYRGGKLRIDALVQCNESKKYYLCITNESDRDNTTDFILNNYWDSNKLYLPFTKPKWWHNESKRTIVWSPVRDGDPVPSPWGPK